MSFLNEFRRLDPKQRLQYLASIPLKKRRQIEDILRKQYADEQSRYVEIAEGDSDINRLIKYAYNELKWTPYRIAKAIGKDVRTIEKILSTS